MTAALATLNQAALVTLADCELRIERGLKSFIDVGEALATIRDSRLYRATHGTFEEYCRQRWNLSRPRAYELISAADVVSGMPDTAVPISSARQANALAAVPEPERAEVWREAVERTDGRPTAKVVREVAEERAAPAEPERKPLGVQTPELATAPTVPVAGSGSTSPELERHLRSVPEPTTEAAKELRSDLALESERRAAAAGLRSVLTYLTSRVLEPAQLAQDYVIALDDFDPEQLRFAAETMAAIAALKER